MTPRVFVSLTGVAIAILGLVLLAIPVSMTLSGQSGTCDSGAAFNGVPSALLFNNRAYEEWQDQCASATSTRQAWSWGLVGVGVLAAVGGAVVRRPIPPVAPAAN